MTTLKGLRDRTKSVQSTQKITLAMKMVAGAKLRRAQEQVEAGRPYAHFMREMLENLADHKGEGVESFHPLLGGTGKIENHLILVATSDRGLCGSFNSSIVKACRKAITAYEQAGEKVLLFCVGRQGKVMLEREYGALIKEFFTDIGYPRLHFSDAQRITDSLTKMFEDKIFDKCTLIYNHFKSAMTQEVVAQQLIPLPFEAPSPQTSARYTYEPAEDILLKKLLPQNIAVQVYTALLENAASEQGARMTAMDSANRNAVDMIRRLQLTYNRTRQAQITRELVEIISGAEALAF